ncbi:MAG: AAA family ATPase [Propionibacteriales bacterium]|nr:AAA family ATPase [Propionibacteriales bacterium]
MTYTLVPGTRRTVRPLALDPSQRAVVEHRGGPLLVLAGPGTGKTSTLVEAVVDRIDNRGLSPAEVLVLTFSRKAAEELRDRIAGRLNRTVATPLSSTFHSFCYSLVRRFQPADVFTHPLQLLSAPEQDVRIRELLAGGPDTGKVGWPSSLEQALRTRGFAEQLRTALARARELSLDPVDLQRIADSGALPEWSAVAEFFEEYLDVLDAQNHIDYAELVHRAVRLTEDPDVRRQLREEFRAIFVDEYQDTDPAQVRLLQALGGDGRDLVVVGDPDQSIYGFRGADVRGILRFPREFRTRSGDPAPVLPLRTTRRFGPRLLTASRRVAAGLGVSGGIEPAAFEAFRTPRSEGCPYGAGRVDALTFTSSGAELAHLADLLRRAHLEDGIPWTEMAVLVRSGLRSIPPLRRALVGAGVPVEVATDEVPLRQEPAVQPLLLGLRVAAHPDSLDPEVAQGLLMSPLGGMDATAVRRLARRLRDEDREANRGERLPRPSGELLAASLRDPVALELLGDWARPAARLARLLSAAREQVGAGEPPEQVLWTLWSGTPWMRRLRSAVDRGGAAARAAHRDLDAVCALFETAARAEERSEHRGVAVFLAEIEGQRIPADTLADRGVRTGAVRLLTAHRSKGLEWRLVVVAGVQEGAWPDLRHRGSLLQADRLSPEGLVPPLPTAQLLAEERRLFYVAVTRARERLVVTAVQSPDAEGEQPSRLVSDLGVTVTSVSGPPRRPLSLGGVVGALRRTAGDPAASPALRRAAAARLARLAAEHIGEEPVVPYADPATWWGILPPTAAEVPVRPVDEPLALSGSAVSSLMDCPLRWFLAREAGGETVSSTAQGFGKVIHVLADQVTTGRVEADADALSEHLQAVWDQLQFSAPWVAERERETAKEALRRLVAWHNARPERTPRAAEHGFAVEIPVVRADGSTDTARVRGSMDRVETDEHGRLVVVDFKTGSTKVTGEALAEHPQLGVYQLSVQHGAVDELVDGDPVAGGAELVQLRQPAGTGSAMPKVQRQPPPEPDEHEETVAGRQLRTALETVRSETFTARINPYCRFCDFQRVCPAQPGGATVLSPGAGTSSTEEGSDGRPV